MGTHLLATHLKQSFNVIDTRATLRLDVGFYIGIRLCPHHDCSSYIGSNATTATILRDCYRVGAVARP